MFDQENRIYCATQEATGKTVKAMTMKTMKATTMKTKKPMKATGTISKATVKTKKAMTMKTMKATAKTIKAEKANQGSKKAVLQCEKTGQCDETGQKAAVVGAEGETRSRRICHDERCDPTYLCA